MRADMMMNAMQERLKEIGVENMVNNMQGKLKEIKVEEMVSNMQLKLKESGAETMANGAQQKLKGLFLLLQNFTGSFIAWLDQVFPPGTRAEKIRHWIQIGGPYIILGLFLFIFFRLCLRRFCCCSSGRGFMAPAKMMKAPGRGYMMPRFVFESDPASYFHNLHHS